MEVGTNKIDDVRKHCKKKLLELFTDREADTLIYQLLTFYSGLNKAQILAKPNAKLSESELLKIHFGIKDLLKDKPIQYILGFAEFYGLTFEVNSKVLIPRPETEEMVHKILTTINHEKKLKVLDIGTGSGCIAITLKKYLPDSEIHAIDISEFALEVAKRNAENNRVVVQFKKLDFLDPKIQKEMESYDLIVSNPPYVRPSEKKYMKRNVLDFEPGLALFVEEDNPLAFYKAIADFCQRHLNSDGTLFCEINQYLSDETYEIFKEGLFKEIELELDLFQNNRFIKVIK